MTEKTLRKLVDYIDNDEIIDCMIGGVHTEMLIDSGSKYNLLTNSTWERLKEEKIVVKSREKPKMCLYALW